MIFKNSSLKFVTFPSSSFFFFFWNGKTFTESPLCANCGFTIISCINSSDFLQHCYAAAAAAKSRQSCPTLCDPTDSSPPGSPVPGILLARTLEWVAISFSNAWKWKVKVKSLSRVRLLVTPWTAAHQAPLSMWFSRQECHCLLQHCYEIGVITDTILWMRELMIREIGAMAY